MVAMNWLSREETVALGWTLLHFIWQGTAVALAYALVDRLTRRSSTSLRYLVVLGALALMPLAVIATFANEMQHSSSVAETTTLPTKPISLLNFDALQPRVARTASLDLSPTMNQRRAWLVDHLEPALPWIDGVWMIGVSLLAIRAMGGWSQLQRLRKRARWFIPAELEDQFHQMCQKMHLGQKITLRISEEVISPLVMGAWRATVILPVSAVLRMPPSELEAVLAHELGHIRRLDYLCNLFQTAVESVLFFHPAVWWLSRTLRERREVCCDEIAVSVCADPVVYAQALLRLEEQKTTHLQLAIALRGSDGSLLRRVRLVLGDGSMTENRTTSGVRVAAATILAMGLLFGPKVKNVVAAPLITVSQTAFNHALPAVSLATRPQSDATSARVKVKSEDQMETKVSVAPTPAADVDVNVNVEPKPFPEVRAGDITLMAFLPDKGKEQSSQGTGESKSLDNSSSPKGSTYIEQMRAAGYPLDLNNDIDTLIALKSLGVTPDYAKSMSQTGLGKPSIQDLIAMKSLGVTPEYLTSLKQSGLAPRDLNQAVSLKALGVTPEYAAAMKQAGYANLDADELVALKAQGMTPERAKWLKQQFPQATTDELQQAAVFHIDDKFMAEARSHGFDSKDLDKLVKLKISGLLDE